MDVFNDVIKSNSIRKLKDFHRATDQCLLQGDMLLNINKNTYALLIDILIGSVNQKIYTFLEFPESSYEAESIDVKLGYYIDDTFHELNTMKSKVILVEESAITSGNFELAGSIDPDLRYICNIKDYQCLHNAFNHLYNGKKLNIGWAYNNSKIKLYSIRVSISTFNSVNSRSEDPGIMVRFKDTCGFNCDMNIDEFIHKFTH